MSGTFRLLLGTQVQGSLWLDILNFVVWWAVGNLADFVVLSPNLFENMVCVTGVSRVIFDGMSNDLGTGAESHFAHFASVLRRPGVVAGLTVVPGAALVPLVAVGRLVDDDGAPDGLPGRPPVLVLQVPLTVGLGGETIVAQFALVWLLPSMGSHVASQGALVTTAMRQRLIF